MGKEPEKAGRVVRLSASLTRNDEERKGSILDCPAVSGLVSGGHLGVLEPKPVIRIPVPCLPRAASP